MDVDRALEALGNCSKWKLSLYFVSSLFIGFLAGWHMLGIVFIGKSGHMQYFESFCDLNKGERVSFYYYSYMWFHTLMSFTMAFIDE